MPDLGKDGMRFMCKGILTASIFMFGLTGPSMAQERILISSEWGNVTADLADNDAATSLVQQLPVTIEMRDHLRQEETEPSHRHCQKSRGKRLSRKAL